MVLLPSPGDADVGHWAQLEPRVLHHVARARDQAEVSDSSLLLLLPPSLRPVLLLIAVVPLIVCCSRSLLPPISP